MNTDLACDRNANENCSQSYFAGLVNFGDVWMWNSALIVNSCFPLLRVHWLCCCLSLGSHSWSVSRAVRAGLRMAFGRKRVAFRRCMYMFSIPARHWRLSFSLIKRATFCRRQWTISMHFLEHNIQSYHPWRMNNAGLNNWKRKARTKYCIIMKCTWNSWGGIGRNPLRLTKNQIHITIMPWMWTKWPFNR